jgi:hypothetical protein
VFHAVVISLSSPLRGIDPEADRLPGSVHLRGRLEAVSAADIYVGFIRRARVSPFI